jgi:hypothetical protein
MDQHILALFIPILALSIPVIALVSRGLNRQAQIRLEEARIRAGALGGGEEELAALRAEVDDLRRELGEVQERVDFTERILAKPRDPNPPPGPGAA